jgi:phosphatidylinositol alpha-1,6-mannosyltransferase
MPHPPALLVTELYPPAIGGSAVLFENIYTRLPGSEVHVLTSPRTPPAQPSGAVRTVSEHALGTPWWGLAQPAGTWHHMRAGLTIRGHARRAGKATVVHCGRVLPEGVAARLARALGGPRYACWVHGEDLATAASSRELTAVTRWVMRDAAHIFANSANTKAFVERFGVPATRVSVVYPGVDTQRFRPDLDGSSVRSRLGLERATVALSVGRLQARKGHDVAIRAVASLAAALPDLHYVIVGAGEERARLDALVDTLGMRERVHFVGEVDATELPRYFAACDLFLLPNRIEQGDFEGFGIVFLEAAACGKAVVGGASGGVVEAVANGETGLLVDGADVRAVADAVARLAGDVGLRSRLGEAGADRARHRFTWEQAAARVQAIQDGLAR